MPTQDLFENLAVRELLVVLSITGVVIRVHLHLGGQPMLQTLLRKPDLGVLVVAATDESHGLQVETLQSSSSPCLWELLRTFLKAPTVPCGPVPSTKMVPPSIKISDPRPDI